MLGAALDCTKRPSNEVASRTRDQSPRVRASWESDLTSVKNNIATLAQNLEAVQDVLKRVDNDDAGKKNIQTLTKSLQAVRDDMHQLEKQHAQFRKEMKCDFAQRLQRLEDRHTSLQGQHLAMLAMLPPAGQTITAASLDVVQAVNGPPTGGPTEGLKELEEKINSCLRRFEERLSKVEKRHTPQSKLREGAEGLAEEKYFATQDVLVEESHKEDDKKLQEPESQLQDTIAPITQDDSVRISRNIYLEFNKSIWDIAVFAFTRQMNLGASIVIVVCLMINIVLLGLFAERVKLLIQDKMEAFDDESQAAFLFWRVNAGHSVEYQNPITGASLVSSVCKGHKFVSQSNLQLDLADQLAHYLDEGNMSVPSGQFMCILSLLVWYFALVQEVRSIIDVLRASFSVPIASKTRFEPGKADSSKVHLVSMSLCRRILLAVILLARAVVVGILAFEGTLFLISETQAENMILNSLALQMMLNFDEMLVALLPKIPQTVIRYILPLPIPVRCWWWDTWGLFVAICCGLISISAFFQIAYMNPFVDNLRASYDNLCGGFDETSWDFVVGVDEIGIPWAAPTPPSQYDVPRQYYEEAIKIAKNSGFRNLNLKAGQRANAGHFMQVDSGTALKRIMVERPEFKDPRVWQLFDPFSDSDDIVGWPSEKVEVLGFRDFADQPGTVYNNYLMFLLGKEGDISCAQVSFSECATSDSHVFRKLCPGRCGCDLPTAGTIANNYGERSNSGFTGCPSWSQRRKTFVEVFHELPCTDTTNRTQMALWAGGMGDVVRHSNGNVLADHVLSIFDSGGCPDVVQIEFDSRICHETSLPSICPESCGCNSSRPWTNAYTSRDTYCPYSCNRQQPLCITTTVDASPDFAESGRGPFAGLACAFPFNYKGRTYHTCTYEDWHGPWCAVTLRDGASDLWGDCPETFDCVGSQVEALS